MDDVVHGAQGDPIIEEVAEQFDHAAGRAMADQHQGQDQLPQPSLGDRQVEEDGRRGGWRGEGLVEGLFGGVGLLIEELPADLMLLGDSRDGSGAREGLESEALSLRGVQFRGGAGATLTIEKSRTSIKWATHRSASATSGRTVGVLVSVGLVSAVSSRASGTGRTRGRLSVVRRRNDPAWFNPG